MATQVKKPSIQVLVLVIGILLLTGFAFGLSNASLTDDVEPAETAHLAVDGVTYRFAPTTCTITDSDFLAAGPGMVDGEPFWISASADGVNLTVGEESEVERPDENQLWLISVAEVSWEAGDQSVTASAVMRDERDTHARNFRGTLSIECPAV